MLILLPRWFLLLFVACGSVTALHAQSLPPQRTVLDSAELALCGKEVALLGESPTHAFGETLQFKAELVRRLVQNCGFRAVFFESGTYDFLHMRQKQRTSVIDAEIAAAIGGLWRNEEVQSLVPFLREKYAAGAIILGGLDDQIGAGSYASRAMAADLARPLSGQQRLDCLATFERHLQWRYTEAEPYRPAAKTKLLGCLAASRTALSSERGRPAAVRSDDQAAIESFERNVARNFVEDDFSKPDQEVRWFNDRDRSMSLNFAYLASGLPPGSKIIVWAATVHVAKSLGSAEGFTGKEPFGSYVWREYGDRAFSLGFSALAGEYQFTRPPVRLLSAAPALSLEAGALTGEVPSVFLSTRDLDATVEGRALGTGFTRAHWSSLVDGMVIFRRERAPRWLPGR